MQLPSTNLRVGGSFINDGVFGSGSGAVTMTVTVVATQLKLVVQPTLAPDETGGSWTVTEHATATAAIVLEAGNSFTVEMVSHSRLLAR